MTAETSAALIRASLLYLPTAAAVAAWLWRAPASREQVGILIAGLWCFPMLVAANALAQAAGAWAFHARGGLLYGAPLDLLLGWSVLWGVLPALLLPRLPLLPLAALALAFDAWLMPLAAPVVVLGARWWIADAAAIAAVLLPAQCLFRWIRDDRRLGARVALEIAGFAALVFWILPASVFALRGGSFAALDLRGDPGAALWLQVALLPMLLGVSAVTELGSRGDGTPLPWDPPRRLVCSGLYAYLRNPMQASVCLALVGWGLFLGSGWVVAGAVVAAAFSAGIAAWHEEADLRARWGARWSTYRQQVPAFVPRWRPWVPEPARLYYGAGCGACEELAGWVRRLRPRGLRFVPASEHPQALDRLTYVAADGSCDAGVAALARALEHVHLGWALLGCLVRLPGARQAIQLVVDAAGGGRRTPGAATRGPVTCAAKAPASRFARGHGDTAALVRILRSAFSGELGARIAYAAHWRTLGRPDERAAVRRIEREELHHREAVGRMLSELGARPSRGRELVMWAVGTAIGWACRIGGWYLPMYGAGRIEARNIVEYENAARRAHDAGRVHLVDALLQMAEVEWDHEDWFRRHCASHWLSAWLPLWPRRGPRQAIRERFEAEGGVASASQGPGRRARAFAGIG